MQYLLDTVAVIRYFSGTGRIGQAAKKVFEQFEQSENIKLVISVVSLMEIMYLAEKHRIPIELKETLKSIRLSGKYTIADLTPEILEVAENIAFPELHDRLILATAKWLDIPIISSDSLFKNVPDIKIIWDKE